MKTALKKVVQKLHDPKQVCPANIALDLIANKWAVKILFALCHAEKQTMRFGQIQKTLETITQRELTKHLREFEKAGLVTRLVYPEVPPRVEYAMTALGDSLCKPIEILSDWAEQYGATVHKNRQKFEQKKR